METTQTDKSEGAEVKHSPLPFAVGEPLTFHKREFIPVTTQIKIPGGSVDGEVCLCASPEDAAFIVRACNSHDKLVEALKNCALALEQSYDATEWPANGSLNQEIASRQARKLIAEVEAS